MSDEITIEAEIQSKGLNAPRLTPDDITNVIESAYYHVIPNTTVTICCLTLANGFNVIGKSAAVSLENFDEEIGKKVAYNNARDQIWDLEGYLLKQRVYEKKLDDIAIIVAEAKLNKFIDNGFEPYIKD